MTPEGWEIMRLEDCVPSCAPICYGILMPGQHCAGGVPVVKVRDIFDGRIDESDLLFTHPSIDGAYKRSRLAAGDLLITIRGTTGRIALTPPQLAGANITQDTARIRVKGGTSSEFVYFALQSEQAQQQIALHTIGQAVKGINIRDVRRLTFPIPKKEDEQRAIARALSDVDALLARLDRLVAKKCDLKEAAMQQLLTGRTRLPGFEGEWSMQPFGQVLERLNTKRHQIQVSEYQSTGTYSVVDQGKEPIVGYSDHADRRFRCPNGGVIVFGDHTCIVKFVDFDFLVGADGTQVLASRPGQSARFHAYQLQHAGIKSTGYNRHFGHLKNRSFVVPPFAEQTVIAGVLSGMDAELKGLELRRQKTRALKQAMMQVLLTGRNRLI